MKDLEMKNFKVELVHELTRHAIVSVEATSEKEAIDIARKLEWEDFDSRANSEQTLWKVRSDRVSFLDMIASMFK